MEDLGREQGINFTRKKVKHIMQLAPSPFNMIKDGTKTIELCLYDEKRRMIHEGDIIEFINTEGKHDLLLQPFIINVSIR